MAQLVLMEWILGKGMQANLCRESQMKMKRISIVPISGGKYPAVPFWNYSGAEPNLLTSAFGADRKQLLFEGERACQGDTNAVEALGIASITVAAGIELQPQGRRRYGGIGHLLEERVFDSLRNHADFGHVV